MKKLIIWSSIIACAVIILAGCAALTGNGKSSKAVEKAKARIENVDKQIGANTTEKLDSIATLAYGTEYALSKVNNPPKAVQVAQDMNKRVESLAGNPSLDQMKQMQDTIDKLTSQLATEQAQGAKQLAEKDVVISNIQDESKTLLKSKEDEINKYMVTAQTAAATADAYHTELQDYQGYWGLSAVWMGLKSFFTHIFWTAIIISVLFIILRVAAASNPIAASIFGIFSIVGSWLINTIEFIIPKAVSVAGNVSNSIFNSYKSTLTKIVDGVQTVQDRSTAAGKPALVSDVMTEIGTTMDSSEKAIVDNIKKSLNWKQ